MKKAVTILQRYLVFASPFVFIVMAWSYTLEREGDPGANPVVKIIWEILSWNLILWFTALLFFAVILAILPSSREDTIRKLARIQERDEREELITGRAARSAFITTLSMLLFLLLLSTLRIEVRQLPQDQAIAGKTGILSIGMGFEFMDREKSPEPRAEGKTYFASTDVPVSKSGLLLLTIICLVGTFHLSARRELKDG